MVYKNQVTAAKGISLASCFLGAGGWGIKKLSFFAGDAGWVHKGGIYGPSGGNITLKEGFRRSPRLCALPRQPGDVEDYRAAASVTLEILGRDVYREEDFTFFFFFFPLQQCCFYSYKYIKKETGQHDRFACSYTPCTA